MPFTDNATGNAASPTKESGAGLGTPDAEALLSDHQFSVGNPIESFGLTSISILFAFSVFIASRHAIRHGKTPRE